jgi:energy-coupling factor transporter ATP-binding protein EcfA2
MNINVLDGPNFSGRTERLRKWVGLPTEGVQSRPDLHSQESAYIGPDCSSALTGIAPTVAAEIELLATDAGAARAGLRTLEDLGFGYCLQQNPFTLSGGEQVVTSIVAAMAGRPKRLAIDCALEQLSHHTRSKILAYLRTMDGDLLIADNRLDEWWFKNSRKAESAPEVFKEAVIPEGGKHSQIELIDLSYAYKKDHYVFEGLNLSFDAGRRYLLKGPNGSGKTTLSKILCGLLKPNSGEIRIDGRHVEPWKTPGKYIAYHFQNPDFQMFSTRLHDQFGGKTSKQEDVIKYFGLEKLLNEHPLDLPYVYKKRTAIAAAFCRKSIYTILDEPTIGQDNTFVSLLTSNKSISPYMAISHSDRFSMLPVISLGGKGESNNKKEPSWI